MERFTHPRVEIEEWNSRTKEYFEREKRNLMKIFPEAFELHHVGSTAVPGLGGKNIPDMLLVAPDRKKAEMAGKLLESAGYHEIKSAGDEHRIFYNVDRKFDGKMVHMHMHVMWKTENDYKEFLLFRDYMINHPKEARRYFSLKKEWAGKANNVRAEYTKMKVDYVKGIIKKARKEPILS